MGGAYHEAFDDWFLYYHQGFHDQMLYRVRKSDAEALFPKVLDKLERANPAALVPDVREGFQGWLETKPGKTDAVGLLARMRAARLDRLSHENPDLFKYVSEEEADARNRWERAQNYRWNLVFEFCLFGGLLLVALWPWFRGAGQVRWAIHLALLPVLFLAPYWLGYAQWTFTSLGPSGGVLYPHLLVRARTLPWTSWDTSIVQQLPQVLEPLSQTTGMPLVLSGGPSAGPCAALGLGIVPLMLVVSISLARRFKNGLGETVTQKG
jgi:hypothetical protein